MADMSNISDHYSPKIQNENYARNKMHAKRKLKICFSNIWLPMLRMVGNFVSIYNFCALLKKIKSRRSCATNNKTCTKQRNMYIVIVF